MPVYVRKNLLSITPDSLSNLSSDEDDYIKDPDQLVDRLPQPFRLIDKIVTCLFDIAWEIISIREGIRNEEQSKVKPPQYNCAVCLDDNDKVQCLCESSDGCYLFIGLPNRLAIINAANQSPVASWEQEGVEIQTIQVCLIGVQTYLLVTLDAKCVLRLFCCAFEGVHLVKIMNEDLPPGSTVIDVQPSRDGDYLAATVKNEAETWLDVYKLPHDTWVRELENAQTAAMREQKAVAESDDKQEVGDDGGNEDGVGTSTSKVVVSPPVSARGSPMPSVSIGQIQLSKPVIVSKIRPLPRVITACTAAGNQLASFKAPDDGNIIGLGNRHIIQEQHLEMRRSVFRQLCKEQLRYLPKEEHKPRLRAQCVFLNPGLVLSYGLETNSADRPNSIAVAWTGGTNVCYYNLLKQNIKDLEGKPEVIWPCVSPVTVLATSPCTSLLAIGQQDGSVIVWDNRQGIALGVKQLSRQGQVKYLQFIGAAPLEIPVTQSYLQPPKVFLLAGCTDGLLCVLKCGHGESIKVQHVEGPAVEEQDKFTLIEPLSTIPHVVLLVRQTCEVSLVDVIKKQVLCTVGLLSGYKLSSPMTPVISQAACAQILYLKGEKSVDHNDNSEDTEGNSEKKSAIFMFQLCSFPCLDGYVQKASQEHGPFIAHVTAQKRFDALLVDRLNHQNVRQQRMQERWSKLRGAIDNLPRNRTSSPALKP